MSDYNRDNNRMVWADVPVSDLDRSFEFYKGVLGIEVSVETFGEIRFEPNASGPCQIHVGHKWLNTAGWLIKPTITKLLGFHRRMTKYDCAKHAKAKAN